MSHLPPDPPCESVGPMSAPERKASPASMLTGPRPPVTRWNRKYLLAGSAALAGVVALGFYLGFGGSQTRAPADQDPQAAAGTQTPQRPEIANRFARGYGDPGLQASAPGMAILPPPDEQMTEMPVAAGSATPAAPPPVDPAVQEARDQAHAARAAGPFFGGQPVQVADIQAPAPAAGLAAFDGRAAPQAERAAERAAEVQPQNGQGAKRQFMAGSRSEDYLASPLLAPLSPWEVKAGTLISAALITAINSDLPGEVIAQVTRPVYDHVTGRTVLIPQGARLIGQYDSQVAYGQERALIAWNRIVMPDGRSINIGSMTGTDLAGASGLRDRTDGHFGQLARGILLSTIFSIGAASAQDAGNRSSGGLVVNSAAGGVSNQAQQVGQRITERDLNRQATIAVRAGWPLQVIVNKDMILAPYP